MQFLHLLLRPIAQDAAADQLAQRRVIGSRQGRPSGELVCRVQAQADYRDPRRVKQRQEPCTDTDRILHRVLPVFTAAPEPLQFRPPDDHGGVNPHRVGFQGNELPGGVHGAVVIVPGKPGHHLQDQ